MSSFTASQQRAIELRGNVLVIAGAGTGKTRTLVHRCVEWLLESPRDHSLDQILMVTFTDAAAAEMRQRIREELKGRIDQQPDHSPLAEQLALLDTAFISTLHSFCFRLVRQHFYELELDPQLAVMAEEEARLLAEETLSGLFEKHYAGETEAARAVQRLIQIQARGWELPVRRLVLRLHHYIQTLPDPDGWLTAQVNVFAQPDPRNWREWLKTALGEWKSVWQPLLQAAGGEIPNISGCRAALQALPADPTVAEAHQALDRIMAADQQPWPRGSVGKVRDPIKDFFQEAEFLFGLTGKTTLAPELKVLGEGAPPSCEDGHGVCTSEDPLTQDWEWARPHMLTLLELTREFGRDFAGAKRELGVVDFHDLEQFSLKLLWDTTTQRPTALAEEWRQKLRLIFVDEYQDINAAQDAILRALGGDNQSANRFLVGDPKQSIYRFRRADPHIFHAYAEQWSRNPGPGQVVALADNFRSRDGILAVINSFFATVMRADIGGVAYDARAWLNLGNPAGRKEALASYEAGPDVEFHLRLMGNKEASDSTPDDGNEDGEGLLAGLNDAEKEARLLGLRLLELREGKHLIWDCDSKQHRPVEWRDMVILLRSPHQKAEGYAKEFFRLGIPLIASRGGFFENTEISDLLSLLTLLDNPLQDVPLLAVLRSPFVTLSFDQLALIRLAAKGRYWMALKEFHRTVDPKTGRRTVDADSVPEKSGANNSKLASALSNPALRAVVDSAWQKVDIFLRQFRGWRRFIRETSLSQGLDRILVESQYAAFLMGADRSEQQKRNVSQLVRWARRFDQFQRQGLYRFLKFIEAQRDAQIDHEPAPIDTAHAVRLMSIHQSKGLEFPVVAVADLGKSFNLSDLKSEIILDEQFGLCPLVKPPFTEQRYPSLPYWLARRRQRRETLGEEMRLLYVAMTRACQRLILSGTTSVTAPDRWTKDLSATSRDLLGATNYLDWIGPWMVQATGRKDWPNDRMGQSPLLRWVIYEQDDPRLSSVPNSAQDQILQSPRLSVDPVICERLFEKLAWKYPFTNLTEQPAKVSVSTLRAGILAELQDEGKNLRPGHPRWVSRSRNRLTGTALGIAHHIFLEHASIDKLQELGDLQAEAERLERDRLLSAEERESLDLGAISAFWRSAIGQEILAHGQHLHRELPFTARLSIAEMHEFQAAELAELRDAATSENALSKAGWAKEHCRSAMEGLDNEFIIVTGVVDLAVILPEEIWFLDFKTDAIDAREWKAKARQYEPQMKLYSMALSRIYSRPVTRRWLHSLTLRRTLQ